jgi:porphobilinogen synthase
MNSHQRPRRLRSNQIIRDLVRETRISKKSLIYPIFVQEGINVTDEIASMEGQFRYSPDRVHNAYESMLKAGVHTALLFGIPLEKDSQGSGAYAEKGALQEAIRIGKREYPELKIVTDVCLCEYTSHGHCGLLDGERVLNDETLDVLARVALSHVEAGADMVAPSDMMDGRVLAIRNALDHNKFEHIPILSYAVKYASSFYGPFREAASCAPSFGDRKSYQMDYHNSREAIKEAELDFLEGADILMVKPALSYLDVIRSIKEKFTLPVAAYSVSGEYSMIKAASRAGYIDEEGIVCETTASIFRAGADILITYYAKEIARFIEEGRIG